MSILDPSNLPKSESNLHDYGDSNLKVLLQHFGTEKQVADHSVSPPLKLMQKLADLIGLCLGYLLLRTIECKKFMNLGKLFTKNMQRCFQNFPLCFL